jgi:hypothetical protein
MYPKAILNSIYKITVVCCQVIAIEILKGQFLKVSEIMDIDAMKRGS